MSLTQGRPLHPPGLRPLARSGPAVVASDLTLRPCGSTPAAQAERERELELEREREREKKEQRKAQRAEAAQRSSAGRVAVTAV